MERWNHKHQHRQRCFSFSCVVYIKNFGFMFILLTALNGVWRRCCWCCFAVVCTRNKIVYFYKIIIFLVDHQPKIKNIFTTFLYFSLFFSLKTVCFRGTFAGLHRRREEEEDKKSLRGNDKIIWLLFIKQILLFLFLVSQKKGQILCKNNS